MKPLTKDLGKKIEGFESNRVYYDFDIQEAIVLLKKRIHDQYNGYMKHYEMEDETQSQGMALGLKEAIVILDECFKIQKEE